jgi:GxxExxY protein
MSRDDIPDATDKIATQVVDAGFQVHQALGPGLLESACEECLAYELTERGIAHRRQVGMPLFYKGLKLDVGYRIDLLVASCVVVEVKAIDTPPPIHVAQVITYLKLSDCRVGLLMNFNTKLFKTGVRRIAL